MTSATATFCARSRVGFCATGNISNSELIALFAEHLEVLTTALEEAHFVELQPDRLIVHRER